MHQQHIIIHLGVGMIQMLIVLHILDHITYNIQLISILILRNNHMTKIILFLRIGLELKIRLEWSSKFM
jgi:hypothetical protein